jgi:hypothetical protein
MEEDKIREFLDTNYKFPDLMNRNFKNSAEIDNNVRIERSKNWKNVQ